MGGVVPILECAATSMRVTEAAYRPRLAHPRRSGGTLDPSPRSPGARRRSL